MNGIILGAGEIGQAYYEILKPIHPNTYRLDIRPELSDEKHSDFPSTATILHVCLRYDDKWELAARNAISRFNPDYVNVMSTVPPGTTENLTHYGAVHSTTRGLHPNLSSFVMNTPKHIGGPEAKAVSKYFEMAGLECHTHSKAKTTELAHILSNCLYGAEIAFAAEMDKLCRHYGVDYYESVMRYSQTHNEGYARMGYVSKMRPILTPPGNLIGGHCVVSNAKLVPKELRGTIMSHLADFNGK